MTAKEYLSRLRSIELRLMAEANEIEALSDMATHITSAINSDGIHTSGATSDKLGNCVSRLVDLQRDIDSDILMLEKVRGEIIASLENVQNDKYRELLRMRYVGHMTFEEIAIAMDISFRHTTRLHGRALHEFSKKNQKILEMS